MRGFSIVQKATLNDGKVCLLAYVDRTVVPNKWWTSDSTDAIMRIHSFQLARNIVSRLKKGEVKILSSELATLIIGVQKTTPKYAITLFDTIE